MVCSGVMWLTYFQSIQSVVSHFSKTISQTMTFWELGLGLLEVRVILRGISGFMTGVKSWRNRLGEVGHNHAICSFI